MKTQLNYRKVLLYPITAAMLFTGCVRHKNVIENISDNKVLIKDIKDGKERIVVFRPGWQSSSFKNLKWSMVGDTVVVNETFCFDDDFYSQKRIIDESSFELNYDLIHERKRQSEFDSLKNAMMVGDTIKQK